MLHRCLALLLILGLSVVALGQDSAKFTGTWKSKAKVSGHDQTMIIAHDDGKWSVKGTYKKEGEDVGEFVGEDVKLAKGKLHFNYKVTKQPAPKADKGRVTLHFEGEGLRYEFTSGNTTAGRHFARVGEAPKVVAKETPKPAEKKPMPEAGDPEAQYAGIWSGMFPGTSYRLILNIKKEEKWTVEGFLTSAEGKRLGYFKHETAAMTKDKTITSVALWQEKPKDVKGGTGLTLSARPPLLQLDVKAGKGKTPLTAELKRGEKEMLALLKPPDRSEPKGLDDLKPKPKPPAGEPGVMNAGGLIMGMGFLDEGKTLAVGMSNGKLQYWDVGKRELTHTEGAFEAAGPFAVAPNGKFIIRTYVKVTGGSGQGMVQIFDPGTAKQLNLFEAHAQGIRSMMVSTDSRLAISCCGEALDKKGTATVRLWEAETGKVIAEQTVSADTVAISPQVDRFVYATLKGEFETRAGIVHLCDIKGKPLASIQTPHKLFIRRCAFSPDGKTLATVGDDGLLVLTNLTTKKPMQTVELVAFGKKLSRRLSNVVFSPDGKVVVVGQENGYVFYRDAVTGAEMKTERIFTHNTEHMAFSPADGKLAIAATSAVAGRIVLRDLPAAP